jgi:hypothetical protein
MLEEFLIETIDNAAESQDEQITIMEKIHQRQRRANAMVFLNLLQRGKTFC